ncbi:MAG: sigma-70 family RNA polymerase sigma factor, partial [Candidatus Latescibacterota bacterium]
MNTPTLETLVLRAAGGEEAAFAALVRAFQDMAYGYAHALLGDFHLARDAAQETFVEVYRHLGELRAPAAFPAWLCRIVRKHCDRLARRRAPVA